MIAKLFVTGNRFNIVKLEYYMIIKKHKKALLTRVFETDGPYYWLIIVVSTGNNQVPWQVKLIGNSIKYLKKFNCN
jgi:hypothetical protein